MKTLYTSQQYYSNILRGNTDIVRQRYSEVDFFGMHNLRVTCYTHHLNTNLFPILVYSYTYYHIVMFSVHTTLYIDNSSHNGL